MTTRYTARAQARFGVPGLPSGFQGKSVPDIVVPSVGIADVDRALFDLFDSQIPLVVSGDGVDGQRRVPVVFFAGEKWALNKRLRAIKDRNGSLVLPLVTAVRTSIRQDTVSDVTGRGINQQTGEIVVHRRLDSSDRGYQQLVNRLLLQNQRGLAVAPGQESDGQLTTLRTIGDLEDDPTVGQGGVLVPDRLNNVYETIVVPAPQFFSAQYDVIFWTQYTSHMNQMIEAVIASFLPQGNAWRLETPQGYWFVATVGENAYTADLNADDYSQTERLIRYRFTINVPGYVLASNVPGAPVPIKRYVSSPTISFQTGVQPGTNTSTGDVVDDPYLGADDPTLPLDTEGRPRRRDLRLTDDTLLYPSRSDVSPGDPALKSFSRGTTPAQYQKITGVDKKGRLVTKLVRIKSQNSFTGETVLADGQLGGLNIVLVGS